MSAESPLDSTSTALERALAARDLAALGKMLTSIDSLTKAATGTASLHTVLAFLHKTFVCGADAPHSVIGLKSKSGCRDSTKATASATTSNTTDKAVVFAFKLMQLARPLLRSGSSRDLTAGGDGKPTDGDGKPTDSVFVPPTLLHFATACVSSGSPDYIDALVAAFFTFTNTQSTCTIAAVDPNSDFSASSIVGAASAIATAAYSRPQEHQEMLQLLSSAAAAAMNNADYNAVVARGVAYTVARFGLSVTSPLPSADSITPESLLAQAITVSANTTTTEHGLTLPLWMTLDMQCDQQRTLLSADKSSAKTPVVANNRSAESAGASVGARFAALVRDGDDDGNNGDHDDDDDDGDDVNRIVRSINKSKASPAASLSSQPIPGACFTRDSAIAVANDVVCSVNTHNSAISNIGFFVVLMTIFTLSQAHQKNQADNTQLLTVSASDALISSHLASFLASVDSQALTPPAVSLALLAVTHLANRALRVGAFAVASALVDNAIRTDSLSQAQLKDLFNESISAGAPMIAAIIARKFDSRRSAGSGYLPGLAMSAPSAQSPSPLFATDVDTEAVATAISRINSTWYYRFQRQPQLLSSTTCKCHHKREQLRPQAQTDSCFVCAHRTSIKATLGAILSVLVPHIATLALVKQHTFFMMLVRSLCSLNARSESKPPLHGFFIGSVLLTTHAAMFARAAASSVQSQAALCEALLVSVNSDCGPLVAACLLAGADAMLALESNPLKSSLSSTSNINMNALSDKIKKMSGKRVWHAATATGATEAARVLRLCCFLDNNSGSTPAIDVDVDTHCKSVDCFFDTTSTATQLCFDRDTASMSLNVASLRESLHAPSEDGDTALHTACGTAASATAAVSSLLGSASSTNAAVALAEALAARAWSAVTELLKAGANVHLTPVAATYALENSLLPMIAPDPRDHASRSYSLKPVVIRPDCSDINDPTSTSAFVATLPSAPVRIGSGNTLTPSWAVATVPALPALATYLALVHSLRGPRAARACAEDALEALALPLLTVTAEHARAAAEVCFGEYGAKCDFAPRSAMFESIYDSLDSKDSVVTNHDVVMDSGCLNTELLSTYLNSTYASHCNNNNNNNNNNSDNETAAKKSDECIVLHLDSVIAYSESISSMSTSSSTNTAAKNRPLVVPPLWYCAHVTCRAFSPLWWLHNALTQASADLSEFNSSSRSDMLTAVADIEHWRTRRSLFPLLFPCNKPALVPIFLSYGASPNGFSGVCPTPLSLVASAPPPSHNNGAASQQKTGLTSAAAAPSVHPYHSMAILALSLGADANAVFSTLSPLTPLIAASAAGNVSLCRALVRAGAKAVAVSTGLTVSHPVVWSKQLVRDLKKMTRDTSTVSEVHASRSVSSYTIRGLWPRGRSLLHWLALAPATAEASYAASPRSAREDLLEWALYCALDEADAAAKGDAECTRSGLKGSAAASKGDWEVVTPSELAERVAESEGRDPETGFVVAALRTCEKEMGKRSRRVGAGWLGRMWYSLVEFTEDYII